ncbi:MAG: FAD-dependent oxidoreductase, partial [Acidimicrobiales bacterium]
MGSSAPRSPNWPRTVDPRPWPPAGQLPDRAIWGRRTWSSAWRRRVESGGPRPSVGGTRLGYDLVIVGGGLWGSSAARAAVAAGMRSVLLLEAGIGLAQESSAKSGGILTDLLTDPEDQALVTRSRALYQEAVDAGGDPSIMLPLGMLTLAEGDYVGALFRRRQDLNDRGVAFELLDRSEVALRHPLLDRL